LHTHPSTYDTERLIQGAWQHDKWSIARLISLFEDTRPHAAQYRHDVLSALQTNTQARCAAFIGLTGTPGAGKSSLIAALLPRLLAHPSHLQIAVLAIDPSSPLTGGAVLGDRIRVRLPSKEKRCFFRSQSSDQDLGGLSRKTFQVCRLLYWLFDLVLIETVGIGQSEVSIRHAADRVYLLLSPLAGDEIQFIKAGIMEIPDAFVLHKADAPAANATYHTLQATLGLLRPPQAPYPALYRTSIHTQEGLDALAAEITAYRPPPLHASMHQREAYAFQRWLLDEYGQQALRCLSAQQTNPTAYLRTQPSFEHAQLAFDAQFWSWAASSCVSRNDTNASHTPTHPSASLPPQTSEPPR